MKQRPIAIGLFVCDQVIVEEHTKNMTPVNCFTRRAVSQFPSVPISFAVFAGLTDGIGETAFEFVIYSLDDLEEIYFLTWSFRFADPRQQFRFVMRVRDCSFPSPGKYQATLSADGEELAQQRFLMYQREN